jgi:hypothetical protein
MPYIRTIPPSETISRRAHGRKEVALKGRRRRFEVTPQGAEDRWRCSHQAPTKAAKMILNRNTASLKKQSEGGNHEQGRR